MQSVAVPAIDNPVIGIAETNGTCQYIAKNYLGIGRAADEFQHLCCRTLQFSYRVHFTGKGIDFILTPKDARYAPMLGYWTARTLLLCRFAKSRFG
jgi:hypothetical protein